MNEPEKQGSGRETRVEKMRTLIICHEGAALDQEGLARWLASFTELVGIVVLREKNERKWRRIKREFKRSGALRFPDVMAFRLYYKLFLAAKDRRWEEDKLAELRRAYPGLPEVPVLLTHSPNSPEAEQFIREARADIALARCKTLIKESVFSLPTRGVLVMHPGVCPEYRNAHGCFWALANRDLGKVGMTLLRIDKGVDTGPIYGYYHYQGDETQDSHIVIQARVVLDHLRELELKLIEVDEGRAQRLDISGRESATWGQPWLTKYLRWKLRARQRKNAGDFAYVSRRD